ncbi:hypothetical protein [Methanolinea mesophila]|uniref:hypothetical protein n=1 Tax=Methanolinea mesophila TaxID=547055 RepID=UPI001AE3C6E4|nr:hypothetical protein [Methanolinea mesophila]
MEDITGPGEDVLECAVKYLHIPAGSRGTQEAYRHRMRKHQGMRVNLIALFLYREKMVASLLTTCPANVKRRTGAGAPR